jgi:hypothetical protein
MKLTPILLSFCMAAHANLPGTATKSNPQANHYPLTFAENKGQFADQNYQPRPDILFGGSDGQLTFHISNKGISYQQYRVDSYKQFEDPTTKEKRNEIDQQTIYRTDIKWVNANLNPKVKTDDVLPGFNNYYLEQCPNGAINVKTYKGITLQNIYNNIDLHYYEKEGLLKCDYIVAPHTDYKQIQLKVEGANVKLQNDGSLLIETPLGKIQEQAPLVYQNGKRLEARYILKSNVISFDIKDYNNNQEMIIDPVTRLWGTYYGGSGVDLCKFTTTDASGDVYVAGHTNSSSGTVIATTGSHQNTFSGASFDAFLVKFNSAGVRLWGTYYGGTSDDLAIGCAADVSGNIFMAGYTSSNTGSVLATPGSHQSVFGGGVYDAYLVQFNSSGVRLWGTYYGGTGTDVGNGCAVDPSGNVYMAGYTAGNSGTVIATTGSHQNSFGGGTWDGYLVKFSNAGVRAWATYYGGAANDLAYSCATNTAGDIYIAGHSATNGGTVIASGGSHQTANNGGDDGFLAKFNTNGIRLWATYYGGTANESVYSCSADNSGNVFMAGHTSSNSGAVFATTGCHQSTFGGSTDIFAVKFNNNGVRSWGTYYGGTGAETCWSCKTDASGDVYLVGYSSSGTGTVIATPGSHQTTYGGGGYDTYLVKFRGNGVRAWGTYYGGANDEAGSCSTTDGSGHVYLIGSTNGNGGTVIATPGSHQPAFAGNNEVFLVKFADCNLHIAAVNGPVCSGGTLSLSVNSSGSVNPSYNWAGPNSFLSAVQNPTIANISAANAGLYTLTLTYGICVETTTVEVSALHPQPTIAVNSGSVCSGSKFVIVPSGAITYTITGGSFTVNPPGTNSYSVTGTNSLGCVSEAAVSTVTINACTSLNKNGTADSQSVQIYPNPSSGSVIIESAGDANVKVFDLHGRLKDSFKIKGGSNTASVDQLENGVYLVEVYDVHGKQIFRIIRQ